MLNITDLYIEDACLTYRPPVLCINRLIIEDVCLTYKPPCVSIGRLFVEDLAYVFMLLTVTDKIGNPVTGATVSVVSGSYTGSETTDSNGVSQAMQYNQGVNTVITISKTGYQNAIIQFNEAVISTKVIPITLFKAVTIAHTRKGLATNLQPANSENAFFN